jgi:hypothetical protein
MTGGTPVVRTTPGRLPKQRPDGAELFTGRSDVVEAWHARARRQRAGARSAVLVAIVLAVLGTLAEAVPIGLGLSVTAAAAALYPLSLLVTGARAAQRPFEVYEDGVWATEDRRFLAYRRFVEWPDMLRAEAHELLPGRFLVKLTAIDGSTMSSIPGEVPREAVETIDLRTHGLVGIVQRDG